LSLISFLAGLVIFGVGVALVVMDCFVCTLGVGAFMIGLLIVAAVIGVVVCVRLEVVVSFGFGAVSLGGPVTWSKVTHLFSCSVLSGGVENIVGELFKMSSSFLSASICSTPFMLFYPFNACIRSFSALIAMPAGVSVGCVMSFVLKYTVSDILLLFVCFTYIL
jgi:hypothetical protein